MSKYSRSFDPRRYAEETKFPVTFSLVHNDGPDVRCMVAISDTSELAITMPLDEFNALPVVEV
jgi:hypothetical protein